MRQRWLAWLIGGWFPAPAGDYGWRPSLPRLLYRYYFESWSIFVDERWCRRYRLREWLGFGDRVAAAYGRRRRPILTVASRSRGPFAPDD